MFCLFRNDGSSLNLSYVLDAVKLIIFFLESIILGSYAPGAGLSFGINIVDF